MEADYADKTRGNNAGLLDYHDARIAEIYDVANSWAPDEDFYSLLAAGRPLRILDLGCGTGALCCGLVERGHRVTGVDPAGAMLAMGRRKPYADRVEWVEATAQSYRSERRFELIVMTGHAFQCLLTDDQIRAALATMRLHLGGEGGRVAFETRNPRIDWAKEWAAREPVVHTVGGEQVVETLEVTEREGEFISFRTHYHFAQTTLSTSSTLRFPSKVHVEALMLRSGLAVREVFGDWDGSRFDDASSREIIFVGEARD